MYRKEIVQCPVCKMILGRLDEGETCSFPCGECGWVYSWDKNGKLLKPVKAGRSKKCTCSACKARDARENGEDSE